MKKSLIGFIVLLTVFFLAGKNADKLPIFAGSEISTNQRLKDAYENRQSGIRVGGKGTVVKVLRDDQKGRRHQRFILKLLSGQTLLISHNIDIAPRINTLQKGDTVEFFGEYEWNPKGGIVHWTHHDPDGHHTGGWLKHNGVLYQ